MATIRVHFTILALLNLLDIRQSIFSGVSLSLKTLGEEGHSDPNAPVRRMQNEGQPAARHV